MPTDIEKVTALLGRNGINKDRYSSGSDLKQLDDYAVDIAGVHRGLYPLDDATVATNAWIRSIGGTDASPSVFTIGAGLTLSFATAGAVTTPTIVATDPAATALAATSTRGAVRRLLTALGISFTPNI